MTNLFGDVIKLEKQTIQGREYVVAEVLIPKNLEFVGKYQEKQLLFENIHFGRVKLIQDEWQHDV